MTSSLLAMLFVPLVFLLLALGAIVGFALMRRNAQEWRERASTFGDTIGLSGLRTSVTPQSTTMSDLFDSNAEVGSAYLDATTLPGYDRLEVAAQRVEATYREARMR